MAQRRALCGMEMEPLRDRTGWPLCFEAACDPLKGGTGFEHLERLQLVVEKRDEALMQSRRQQQEGSGKVRQGCDRLQQKTILRIRTDSAEATGVEGGKTA
eukprot:TRINITY_DN3137_c0_g2_i1.p2 TRINITY_DN3137_c0_g2~~TRINITY_DN3137_c0_g2_i1.p2  ORF type:complete len:101 (+),score=24.82 TRINITY_DN3137_c0_g2_i1:705-1007(+)